MESSYSSDVSIEDFVVLKKSIRQKETTTQKSQSTPKKIESKYKYEQCPYESKKKSNFVRHETIHTKNTKPSLPCPEIDCDYSSPTLDFLDKHLEAVHDRFMEIESLSFSNEEFKVWRNKIQEEESVSYIKHGSLKNNILRLRCHRTGDHKSKSTGQRNLKKLGSIKCGVNCTSRLVVKIMDDSAYNVKYHKTHCGHSADPGRVGLTSPQKLMIAQDIKNGVPKERVLSKIRNSPIIGVSRLLLTNRQDLVNIEQKYNLKHAFKLDPDDATSVATMIKRMEIEGDNGVFLFKPQDVISDQYPTLKQNDFALGYMTEAQEELLKQYGKNIICIDSTHGTNAYNIELTTVLVVDDQLQGFPVAFFFHLSKSECTYNLFFKLLKDRLGENITCQVFMSDDEPSFYNSWKKYMGEPVTKLLCTWHVYRNWKRRLLGLTQTKRDETFGKIHAVATELDKVTFESAIDGLMKQMKNDPELQSFHGYIEQYYLPRQEEWAYCFRIRKGINTNMHMERLHRELKYSYLSGKKVKRLDEGFAAVKKLLRDKHFDRIISMDRGKMTTKDKILRNRHVDSLKGDIFSVVENEENWSVPSFTDKSVVPYTVVCVPSGCNNTNFKKCPIFCRACSACFDEYQCTCTDSSIKRNMCKHIHLVCQYLKKDSLKLDKDKDEFSGNLIIDTNEVLENRAAERRTFLEALPKGAPTDQDEQKRRVREIVESILRTGDQFEIATVLASLQEHHSRIERKCDLVMRVTASCQKEPANKLIDKQPRFMAKKKKSSSTPLLSQQGNHENPIASKISQRV